MTTDGFTPDTEIPAEFVEARLAAAYCPECSYLGIDSDDMHEHYALNHLPRTPRIAPHPGCVMCRDWGKYERHQDHAPRAPREG